MEAIVTALNTSLTAEAFFGALALLVPLIAVIVLFAFSYNSLKKVVKGAAKGKVRF